MSYKEDTALRFFFEFDDIGIALENIEPMIFTFLKHTHSTGKLMMETPFFTPRYSLSAIFTFALIGVIFHLWRNKGRR